MQTKKRVGPKEHLAGQNANTACPAAFVSYRHVNNVFVRVKAKVEADSRKTGKILPAGTDHTLGQPCDETVKSLIPSRFQGCGAVGSRVIPKFRENRANRKNCNTLPAASSDRSITMRGTAAAQ
jgi:hypothetical protein